MGNPNPIYWQYGSDKTFPCSSVSREKVSGKEVSGLEKMRVVTHGENNTSKKDVL